MYVISHRMARFSDGKREHTIQSIFTPVQVPDWVEHDDHFKMLKAAGKINIVGAPGATATKKTDSKPATPPETGGDGGKDKPVTMADLKDALGTDDEKYKGTYADAAELLAKAGHPLHEDTDPAGKVEITQEALDAAVALHNTPETPEDAE